MSFVFSPELLDVIWSLEADKAKALFQLIQRDAQTMTLPSLSSGVNEERERLRNSSTYAERKRVQDRERQRVRREKLAAERDELRDKRDASPDVTRDGHGDLRDALEDASRSVTATSVTPRAHVRDITSTSENNHNYTLLENRDSICDWPEGKAHHHAELICAEMASPWLDLQKSPGLVTTAGRLAAWKRDGASWEHDVLPLIRGRLMNRRSPVTTWAFFDAAIGETVALNRAALAIPEAGTVIPFRQVGPPVSRDEKISNTWDMTIEKFERDEQSQN